MENTLRSFIIARGDVLRGELETLLPQIPSIEVVGTLNEYPSTDNLFRTVRVRKVDLLFLDLDDFPQAQELLAFLAVTVPGLPIITLSTHKDETLLMKLMHFGVREHLTSAITRKAIEEA